MYETWLDEWTHGTKERNGVLWIWMDNEREGREAAYPAHLPFYFSSLLFFQFKALLKAERKELSGYVFFNFHKAQAFKDLVTDREGGNFVA